jgi:hypothetical protein
VQVIWLLAACALRPPLPPSVPVETSVQFKLESSRGTLAGLVAVALGPEDFALQALSPAGLALFTVQGDTVQAPSESWAAVLERLPFERDLRLILDWDCATGRCSLPEGGHLRQERLEDTVVRCYRGPQGPARATLSLGRAELVDPRRGYTLTLVGDAVHVP